ncbi:MAG: hypothetical protein HZC41_02630 [Chloroflexi bacterium]|nr:hypothetical protein [Chloroflexota bacterium]
MTSITRRKLRRTLEAVRLNERSHLEGGWKDELAMFFSLLPAGLPW